MKKKIANRKDKKSMKKRTGKRVWKGKHLHKRSEKEKKQRSKRKGKVIVDKTESIKNISKRNKKKMEREKEGVRKFIYAKVNSLVKGRKQECKC